MVFWSPHPFVRISCFLALGILSARFLNFGISEALLITAVISLPLIYFLIKNKSLTTTSLIGNAALLIVFMLGVHLAFNENNKPIKLNEYMDGYYGQVTSQVQQLDRFQRVELDLFCFIRGDSVISMKGKSILYIRKDSSRNFEYGDQLLIAGQLGLISPPTNPGEFDFSRFWSNRGIYFQDFIEPTEVELFAHEPPSYMLKMAFDLRKQCEMVLERHVAGTAELSIAKALLLGIKSDLPTEIKSAYSASGAMHILAVSGLHVGIIYLFILFAFRPIKDVPLGRQAMGFAALSILWIYAFVTGFSPSVQRAVVMFSIFVLGEMITRKGNVYNSIALSAFVLMLVEPFVLFEVGFQLSYLAVIGIVFLQPRIYDWWEAPNWWLDKLWIVTTVSIAAQIATAPISIYYFNQFPLLFWLSNFIAIPAASIMLLCGVFGLMLSLFNGTLAQYVFYSLEFIIGHVNDSMLFIERLEWSVLRGIHIDLFQVILLYAIIILFALSWVNRSYRMLVVSLSLFFMFILSEITFLIDRSNTREVVFYDIPGALAVDFRNGLQTELFVTNKDGLDKDLEFIIQPDRTASKLYSRDIDWNRFDSWESIEGLQLKFWKETTFVRIVDQSWKELIFEEPLKMDFLILSEDGVENLSEIQEHFEPEEVIVDGTNSYFISNQLRDQGRQVNYAVHSTLLAGAYQFRLP